MGKIKLLLIVIIFLTFSDIDRILAQSTVSYGYDGSGNRTSRITLKSSIAFIADSVKSSMNNKKIEALVNSVGNKKILIYPNPTHNQLFVEIIGYDNESNKTVYLYDLTGKLLISKKLAISRISLDLSDYTSGIYVLKILLGNNSNECKIIKE